MHLVWKNNKPFLYQQTDKQTDWEAEKKIYELNAFVYTILVVFTWVSISGNIFYSASRTKKQQQQNFVFG